MKVVHLSPYNLEGIMVTPWIPDNYMTRNGFEDNKTKRIPVSESIRGAIRALPLKKPGMRLWVNVVDVPDNEIYYPTEEQVPDSCITYERWLLKPVRFEAQMQIILTGDSGYDGLSYNYGDGLSACLYDWDWFPVPESETP